MNRPLYQILASRVDAMANCVKSENHEWYTRHRDAAEYLTRNYMPSGSGIDCGTTIDLDASTGDKLVFNLSFHHMHESGMYDGWTETRLRCARAWSTLSTSPLVGVTATASRSTFTNACTLI